MSMLKNIIAPLAVVGSAVFALPAHAVPALQVYLPGGTYDSAVESWVMEGNAIEVVVAGASTPGWADVIEDVTLWVAIEEEDFLANNLTGSVTLTDEFGDEVASNGGAVFGTPDEVDPHGIFPAYYYEFSLADLLVGTAGETVYDYAGTGQTTGDIATYMLEFTGFDHVHLDLSGTALNDNGSKEQMVVAPYSHDADAYVSDVNVQTASVPEPGIPLLMGEGLLGLGFVSRVRRMPAA